MSDYLDRLDGKLMIRNDDTDSRDPVRRSLWWPVLRTSGWLPCWFTPATSDPSRCVHCEQHADAPIHRAEAALRLSGYDGRYGGQHANGNRYAVEIDPRGQAVKVLETPIACPKVRKGIETRWYRGTWQKYLKAQGWVIA